nr:hypothetical protein Iba_chr09aCG13930 [Ipomoea batatas]
MGCKKGNGDDSDECDGSAEEESDGSGDEWDNSGEESDDGSVEEIIITIIFLQLRRRARSRGAARVQVPAQAAQIADEAAVQVPVAAAQIGDEAAIQVPTQAAQIGDEPAQRYRIGDVTFTTSQRFLKSQAQTTFKESMNALMFSPNGTQNQLQPVLPSVTIAVANQQKETNRPQLFHHRCTLEEVSPLIIAVDQAHREDPAPGISEVPASLYINKNSIHIEEEEVLYLGCIIFAVQFLLLTISFSSLPRALDVCMWEKKHGWFFLKGISFANGQGNNVGDCQIIVQDNLYSEDFVSPLIALLRRFQQRTSP